MFENEDVILPDGFEESTEQPESDDVILPEGEEEQVESEESAAEEETTPTEQEQVEQLLKLKYNGEEKEIPLSEATILAQKGMNYDKIQARVQELESDPRLSFVEQLAQENEMSVEDFLQTFQQQRQQEQLNELIQSNIPEELAQEILENRKYREQQQQEKQQAEQKAQQEAEFGEFFDAFKNVNGRDFNGESDQIPQEVWDLTNQGMSLKDAYNQHQVIELQKQIKILKQNESNKGKAPVGSLSAHGSHVNESEDDFLAGFNSYD